jgi:HK97 gp10 family phage protein
MPASVFVEVKGLQELGERLRLMKSEVSLKIGRQAVNAGAQVIKKQAIANAPIWPKPHKLEGVMVPSGNLKKNIVVKKIKSPLVAEYIVTVRGKKKDAYAARYGRLVEFGTVKMAAEPYLRPAFDSKKSEAVEAIKAKLIAGIEKAER